MEEKRKQSQPAEDPEAAAKRAEKAKKLEEQRKKMLEDRKKITSEKKPVEDIVINTAEPEAQVVQEPIKPVSSASTVTTLPTSVIQAVNINNNSIVYTSKDIDDIKQQARQEAIKDITREVDELRQLYNTELENKKKLQTKLTEYEATVQLLIQEKEQTKAISSTINGANTSAIVQENVQIKSMLTASETKYNKLKVQAEGIVDKANKHIATLTANHTKDLTAWKAKFVILETRANCAEQALAAKELQNQELLKICEEMISKLEQK